MKRRNFLSRIFTTSLAATGATCLPGGLQAAVATKRNILFIAVDDLKPLLNCYGHNAIISPNIDKLADSGTVFLNNQCQQALCGPSRVSVMTGQRPDSTGIFGMGTAANVMRTKVPDILTMPAWFGRHGYETRAIGKIFDPRNTDNGHDTVSWTKPYIKKFISDPKLGLATYQNQKTKKIAHDAWLAAKKKHFANNKQKRIFLESIEGSRPAWECEDVPDNAYLDGAMTLAACKSLSELAAEDKPFFFAVGFHKPHLPFVAPKKYWDLYERKSFKLHAFQKYPKDSPDIARTPYVEARTYHGVPEKGLIPAAVQRTLLHGYAACVSYIDAQIGRLMKILKDIGKEEDTVICLWGDHGFHLGDKQLWGKHTNYEQACRAPLIIVSPDIPGHRTYSHPSEFVDIFPSLCDLAGIPQAENLDGKSLVPGMEDPSIKIKDCGISQYIRSAGMGWSIRTERYRYIEWREKKPGIKKASYLYSGKMLASELYDYEKDPLEKENLAAKQAYAAVLKKMQAIFDRAIPGLPERGDTKFVTLEKWPGKTLDKPAGKKSGLIKNAHSSTELLEAVQKGNLAAVKKLAAAGHNINSCDDKFANTLIIWAVLRNNKNMVQLLLELGADPYIKNNYANSALDLAVRKKRLELEKLIKKYEK